MHLRTYVVRVLAPFPHLTGGKLDVLRTFYNVHINGKEWPIFFIYYWMRIYGTDIKRLCECSYNDIISFPLKTKSLEYEFPIPFIQFCIFFFLYIRRKKIKWHTCTRKKALADSNKPKKALNLRIYICFFYVCMYAI